MAPPTNTTAATAIVISALPFTASVNAFDAGTTYDLWYRYTAVAGDTMIGAFGFGGTVGSGYQPQCKIFGPNDSTASYVSGGSHRAVQFWVMVGAVYYLNFHPNSPTVSPATISIDVQRFAASPYAVGDLLINDDEPGFPLAILSASTGSPLTYRQPFPAGESIAVLNDGTSIWDDVADGIPKIYSAEFTSSVSTGVALFPPEACLTSNRTDTFYCATKVASVLSGDIRRITTTGTVGPVIATVALETGGSIHGIAVSPDESILYYKSYPGAGSGKIKRHNLSTNTAMSDLAAKPSGYTSRERELLCLADGTVIATYYAESGVATDYLIRRYNPDGTIAHTYTAPGGISAASVTRLAYAIDDPGSFWVWYEYATSDPKFGQNLFLRLAVSGSILTSITTQQYEIGEALGTVSATPIRFGHSESCPFAVVRTSGGGGEPDLLPPFVSPSYFEDPRIIRRLRRAPHLSQENVRVFYRKIELDLERGVGLASGQGEDPLVMLRLSRDGGHTWSEPMTMSAGRIGVATQRVIARRLGQARDTVFEVTVSDPVAWSLVDAWLDLEAGTS